MNRNYDNGSSEEDKMKINLCRVFLSIIIFVFYSILAERTNLAQAVCAPGWQGSVLINGDSLTNWTVENDKGSSGSLQLVEKIISSQAVQLNWNIGSGNWVQGKYTFPTPVDISNADTFGISLRGGGASELSNTVSIMFADVNDVFYGYDMVGNNNGINEIDRPLINLSISKKTLHFFFRFGTATQIDWSHINRFFIVVKRPDTRLGGGEGKLSIDHVQYDTAATWPRQTQFETVTAPPQAASNAINYILSQQKSTGLFLSWKEEPSPKAYLYDQALSLIALTREGIWENDAPKNSAAQAAKSLADFLVSVQKSDCHWARVWNPNTGEELLDDKWVGDQAWCVMALSIYSRKSGDSSAMASAQCGSDWLSSQIDPIGKVVDSTEGNVDVWWAMVSTYKFSEANKIKNYLLNYVWDSSLQYWWRGYNDPVIAMDAATWLSAFARHPLVNESDRGMAALSFVRRTLITTSDDDALCGFDGMGPVSIWNEGTAQYVAAGGEDSQTFLDMLISQQKTDGCMPGSPNNWYSDTFGWLSNWCGLAPTAWLYFATKGLPFSLYPIPDIRANGSNGPINITSNDTLSVTVSLDSGAMDGYNADWWVAAYTPWCNWFYYVYPNRWENAGPDLNDISFAYQGPLFNLNLSEILNVSGLPIGTYTLYFGVDTDMNGSLDFGQLNYAGVVVNLTQ